MTYSQVAPRITSHSSYLTLNKKIQVGLCVTCRKMVFSSAKAHSHSSLSPSISNKSQSSSMARTYISIRRAIALETTRAMWSAKLTRVRPTYRLIQADLTYPLYLADSTVMKGSRTVFGATIASTSTYHGPCSDTRVRRSYSGSSKTSRRH